MNPRAMLEELLSSLFDTEELKRWLVLEYPALRAELPSTRQSLTMYVHEAVDLLERHGYIDHALFQRLRHVRPGREADIRAVQDVWCGPAAVEDDAQAEEDEHEPVVRILHLSDFHFRETTAWDAEPVLERLAADIASLVNDGLVPDLIAITGDIAFSGKASEYQLAARWIRERLLPAARAEVSQLFIVPGNHDADRACVDQAARYVAEGLVNAQKQSDVAQMLGTDSGALLLRRHRAFTDFLNQLGVAGAPLERPWHVLAREIHGVRVHCAGFCSAWLSADEQDRGRLLLGLWQCNHLFRGADQADVVIAAMHHPWDYLAEWDQVSRTEIERNAGLVLRGHLHDARHTFAQDPRHDGVLELAAGACYASSEWPNAYHLVELFPRSGRARIHPRYWDQGRRDWQADLNLFRAAYGDKPLRTRPPRP